MRRIVLPQAMRVIIPPTGNEVITMLKTTSLVIAVPLTTDLYSTAPGHLAAPTSSPIPLLLVAATWYLAITQRADGRPVLPGAALLPRALSGRSPTRAAAGAAAR